MSEIICAASGCGTAALWSTSIYKFGADFILPVCREHGTRMAAIHGVRGLDLWEERATRVTALARGDEKAGYPED